jgi:hypothetical protein
MLILLAASRVPSLRSRIPAEVTTLGPHLQKLIETWMCVPAGSSADAISPSVEQSLRMICDVGRFINSEFVTDVVSGGVGGGHPT